MAIKTLVIGWQAEGPMAPARWAPYATGQRSVEETPADHLAEGGRPGPSEGDSAAPGTRWVPHAAPEPQPGAPVPESSLAEGGRPGPSEGDSAATGTRCGTPRSP